MRSKKVGTRRSVKEEEKVETLSNEPIAEVTADEVLGRDGIKQPVKKPPPSPPPDERKAKQYKVLRGGYVSSNGHRAMLRAGKILSDTAYNIDELKKQGVELEPVVAG